jgi:hypothetical protein
MKAVGFWFCANALDDSLNRAHFPLSRFRRQLRSIGWVAWDECAPDKAIAANWFRSLPHLSRQRYTACSQEPRSGGVQNCDVTPAARSDSHAAPSCRIGRRESILARAQSMAKRLAGANEEALRRVGPFSTAASGAVQMNLPAPPTPASMHLLRWAALRRRSRPAAFLARERARRSALAGPRPSSRPLQQMQMSRCRRHLIQIIEQGLLRCANSIGMHASPDGRRIPALCFYLFDAINERADRMPERKSAEPDRRIKDGTRPDGLLRVTEHGNGSAVNHTRLHRARGRRASLLCRVRRCRRRQERLFLRNPRSLSKPSERLKAQYATPA